MSSRRDTAKRKAIGPPPAEPTDPLRSSKRHKPPIPSEPPTKSSKPGTTALRITNSSRNAKDKQQKSTESKPATAPVPVPEPTTAPGVFSDSDVKRTPSRASKRTVKGRYAKNHSTSAHLANGDATTDDNQLEQDDGESDQHSAQGNIANKPNGSSVQVNGHADEEDVPESAVKASNSPVDSADAEADTDADAENDEEAQTPDLLENTNVPPKAGAQSEEAAQKAGSHQQDLFEHPEPSSAAGKIGAEKYKGLTFQAAQDLIVTDLLRHTEDELLIYHPFSRLPPKSLTDYYRIIEHPVSLLALIKKVRGQHGRGHSTYTTDFPTWDDFEHEVGFIWRNCRIYNEDGSDMFNLAGEFEADFKRRLADAKLVVEQPKVQTVRLKLADPVTSKIKIKLGGIRDSAGPLSTPNTPALPFPPTAALSQNGLAAPFTGMPTMISSSIANGSTTGISNGLALPLPTAEHTSNPTALANGTSQITPYKGANGATPAQARRSSISAHKQGQYNYNNIYNSPAYYDGPPLSLVPSKVRDPTQPLSNYLLPHTQLLSHPSLNLAAPFRCRIPASEQSLHQAITLTISGTHHFMQFIPHIPVATTSRPYRLFVTANGTRLSEVVRPHTSAYATAIINSGGVPGASPSYPAATATPGLFTSPIKPLVERDKTRPIFELRLERGSVNRIEVEVLAGRNDAAAADREEVQWEKLSCFIHCLRT